MINIFEDYVRILNYDIFDVLSVYKNLFNKLDIDISDYENSFINWEYPDELQTICKTILIYKAQEENIIPCELDLDYFDLDDEFAIDSEVENCEQIIKDFYDWCGIELNTF